AHALIADPDDRPVGEVTSGTVSPTLGHPVMLARIQRGALDNATRAPLAAIVRNRRLAVTPSPLPFVPKRYRR
ncbi:MAG: glycine cleavage system aminomethyltransferase GcvT, partial [Burkholderiales bacterium]|nr:glycine cleavage system aminomethyltransferase GcvT [Burkholderiales bacterium]